jgi:hypothetical protein
MVFGTGMPKIELPTGLSAGCTSKCRMSPGCERSWSSGVDVNRIEDADAIEFASFADPDGNAWALSGQ